MKALLLTFFFSSLSFAQEMTNPIRLEKGDVKVISSPILGDCETEVRTDIYPYGGQSKTIYSMGFKLAVETTKGVKFSISKRATAGIFDNAEDGCFYANRKAQNAANEISLYLLKVNEGDIETSEMKIPYRRPVVYCHVPSFLVYVDKKFEALKTWETYKYVQCFN